VKKPHPPQAETGQMQKGAVIIVKTRYERDTRQ